MANKRSSGPGALQFAPFIILPTLLALVPRVSPQFRGPTFAAGIASFASLTYFVRFTDDENDW